MTKEEIELKIKKLEREINYYSKVYPRSKKLIDLKKQLEELKKEK